MGRKVQPTDDDKLAKLRERQRRNQANKYKRDQELKAQYEKDISHLDKDITQLIATCRQRVNEGVCLSQSNSNMNEYGQDKFTDLMRIKKNVENLAKEFDTFNSPEESREHCVHEEEFSVVPDYPMS